MSLNRAPCDALMSSWQPSAVRDEIGREVRNNEGSAVAREIEVRVNERRNDS